MAATAATTRPSAPPPPIPFPPPRDTGRIHRVVVSAIIRIQLRVVTGTRSLDASRESPQRQTPFTSWLPSRSLETTTPSPPPAAVTLDSNNNQRNEIYVSTSHSRQSSKGRFHSAPRLQVSFYLVNHFVEPASPRLSIVERKRVKCRGRNVSHGPGTRGSYSGEL